MNDKMLSALSRLRFRLQRRRTGYAFFVVLLVNLTASCSMSLPCREGALASAAGLTLFEATGTSYSLYTFNAQGEVLLFDDCYAGPSNRVGQFAGRPVGPSVREGRIHAAVAKSDGNFGLVQMDEGTGAVEEIASVEGPVTHFIRAGAYYWIHSRDDGTAAVMARSTRRGPEEPMVLLELAAPPTAFAEWNSSLYFSNGDGLERLETSTSVRRRLSPAGRKIRQLSIGKDGRAFWTEEGSPNLFQFVSGEISVVSVNASEAGALDASGERGVLWVDGSGAVRFRNTSPYLSEEERTERVISDGAPATSIATARDVVYWIDSESDLRRRSEVR